MAFNLFKKIKDSIEARKNNIAQEVNLSLAYHRNNNTMSEIELENFHKRMDEASERLKKAKNELVYVDQYIGKASVDTSYIGQGGAVELSKTYNEFQENIGAIDVMQQVFEKAADKEHTLYAAAEKMVADGIVTEQYDGVEDHLVIAVSEINEIKESIAALENEITQLLEEKNTAVTNAQAKIDEIEKIYILERDKAVQLKNQISNAFDARIDRAKKSLAETKIKFQEANNCLKGAFGAGVTMEKVNMAEESWANNLDDVRKRLEDFQGKIKDNISVESQKLYNYIKTYEFIHGDKPSLRHLAEVLSSFNIKAKEMGLQKVCNELGINSTRFTDLDNMTYLDKAGDIMEAMGPDSFQHFISLFHKDQALNDALKNISQEYMMVFTQIGVRINESGDAAFYTRALFDNGLPSGLELAFKPDSENNVKLADITFYGRELDADTVLNNKDLQNIVCQLPTAMRNQVEEKLNLIKDKDNTYHRGVITNGHAMINEKALKDSIINEQLEKNYDNLLESKKSNPKGFLMGMSNYEQINLSKKDTEMLSSGKGITEDMEEDEDKDR